MTSWTRGSAAIVALLLSAVAVLGGCTAGKPRTAKATKESTPAAARPRADRPVVRLSYDVASDHRSVRGVEKVRFTPDSRVCGPLRFRAWPNKPSIARYGGSLHVRRATVGGHKTRVRLERKGAPAGAPGTMILVPLRHCVSASDAVTARLSFTVRMAHGGSERVRTNGKGEMWFASAFPVLAWERGHGWMTEPASDVFGEMQGSEAFRLKLSVVAPRGDAVLGTGTEVGVSKGPRPGTRRHRFATDAVRNVAVSVGDYTVKTRTVAGVRVHLGIDERVASTGAYGWLDKIAQEIPRLQRHFGPFPYRDLWVTVIPHTTGIEFPGAIFYGDTPPQAVAQGGLVGHELAHMWFYGLVGDDQARDPWLDEAFAQYAQGLADGWAKGYRTPKPVPEFARDRVGAPMTYWAKRPKLYGVGVYDQGATMLFEARRRAGAKRWDAAVRAYIRANAHEIARPRDFRAAVKQLPHAVDVLRKYGAIG